VCERHKDRDRDRDRAAKLCLAHTFGAHTYVRVCVCPLWASAALKMPSRQFDRLIGDYHNTTADTRQGRHRISTHAATHCNNTLPHTATPCRTLPHTATHCNITTRLLTHNKGGTASRECWVSIQSSSSLRPPFAHSTRGAQCEESRG